MTHDTDKCPKCGATMAVVDRLIHHPISGRACIWGGHWTDYQWETICAAEKSANRIRELEARIEAYEADIAEMQEVVREALKK